MARMTKESLEAKIKKAEEKVARTGNIYNAACEELKSLRNKMSALENEELIQAFMKSNKTLEEAVKCRYMRAAGIITGTECGIGCAGPAVIW